MRKILAAVIVATVLTAPAAQPAGDDVERRPVDVVICLDVSGSMEALLNSVRARIWDVVNELARMKPTPDLRVGLLTYGTDEATESEGWIVVQSDLTYDLDAVYADLMALSTDGSEERVGHVLHAAVETMDWSYDDEALRVIFVAGNESAIQGQEEYPLDTVAKFATDDGIIINAIYAGQREQAIVENWPEVAQKGGGSFSAIDPRTSGIQIATPQDEKLLGLNALLNTSYLPFGESGAAGLANQVAQDGNASRLGVESCSSRIVTKGTALYNNARWDLVDATLDDDFDWRDLDDSDLPQELRDLTDEERIAYVERKRTERESIQLRIQVISDEREAFLLEAMRERRLVDDLGLSMRRTIREQAMAKGFTCDDC